MIVILCRCTWHRLSLIEHVARRTEGTELLLSVARVFRLAAASPQMDRRRRGG